MVCFGKHILVIIVLFHIGPFPNLSCRFSYKKATLCRFRCCGNSATLEINSYQFYSPVLSIIETKIGVWILVGQKVSHKHSYHPDLVAMAIAI